MLESNETGTAGINENNDSPSDTLPPRRRRRVASRPAGPPVAAAATGSEGVVSAVAEAADPAPGSAAEGTPARPRRRATRK
ncbi:hypothetical protein I3F58_24830, partial [Streptomyces sp. MUM 203J]|uniref:hypothetical protein n=1 Tax=Streptomyces sp. MUM 203J TaxID=2791990 RepID=UPI0023D92DE0